MQTDNIDMTEKNFVGAIDRFVTNTALAGLALIPSIFIVLVTPWRLVQMIKSDPDTGRDGMLLAPGVFFPLSTILSILMIAATVPESTQLSDTPGENRNGISIGSSDMAQMAAAWRAGDVNQIIITFLPIFVYCVLTNAATVWLQRFVGSWWSIRAAIRTGFYLLGGIIGFVSLVVVTIFQVGLSDEQVRAVSQLASLISLILMPWYYFWIFKTGSDAKFLKTLALSLLATLTFAGGTVLILGVFG